MSESFTEAAHLPQTDRDQSAVIAEAEGRATLALLGALRDGDWRRPTDCGEWDVRTMVAHLVAQCEDNIHLGTMLRRELVGRRRYPGKIALDAHMAVQIDDHAAEAGPALVERFALLWPRAVRARRQRPSPMRRIKINAGIPGVPPLAVGYLLDVIYNRDLWMHRIDLARAAGRQITIGDHDRQIVEQVIRDLALAWSAAPVVLELAGPGGGSWLIGSGEPTAVVRTDTVAYMRALSGRDDDVPLELVSGTEAALTVVRQAKVVF
ncbi:maleylpyruvate isomerase family mycothiol-dependent enzyme [Sphaerisporangium sp. NBC_01403]|uniref:maleylpyruvate isomerase family mycothiol-dependent enzyme n=1 Tax=Sphaerisporangium sp. NBC_01403 TaxID=2903599 RepID=UPI003254E706